MLVPPYTIETFHHLSNLGALLLVPLRFKGGGWSGLKIMVSIASGSAPILDIACTCVLHRNPFVSSS